MIVALLQSVYLLVGKELVIMARSVISELISLKERLIEEGVYTDLDGTQKEYSDYTKGVFLRLVDYVRSGSFMSAKTQKFVCRNFSAPQKDLPRLWSVTYPEEAPRAASTFRIQVQEVNKALATMIPRDLPEVFAGELIDRIREYERLIDMYKLGDLRIEDEWGKFLTGMLNTIPSTYNKYTIEECSAELAFIKRASEAELIRSFDACDKKKLAFLYDQITSPSYVGGELNDFRTKLIKAYIEVQTDGVVEINSEGNDTSTSDIGVSTDVNTLVGGDNINGVSTKVVDTLRRYVGSKSYTKDTLINPEIIMAISRLSLERFAKMLKSFPKDEVAYVIDLLVSGDKDTLDMYNRFVGETATTSIGDFVFLPDFITKVQELTDDIKPSDKVSPAVVQVLSDYLVDSCMERLECLNPDELKRAYEDLKSGDTESVTVRLLEKFSSADMIDYETSRLGIKKGNV